jgi:hypothetical protein
MARIGPVILGAASESYDTAARIRAIVWEGASTAGDTCELRERSTGNLLFVGRATGTQTYEGLVLTQHAPGGFLLSQLSSGRVLVYLDEP